MSGGTWNHCGLRIRNALQTISEDPDVRRRFPKLGKVLEQLGVKILAVEHDLDLAFMRGKTLHPDDATWEQAAIEHLEEAFELADPSAAGS